MSVLPSLRSTRYQYDKARQHDDLNDLLTRGSPHDTLLQVSREDGSLWKLLDGDMDSNKAQLITHILVKSLDKSNHSQKEAIKFVVLSVLNANKFIKTLEKELYGPLEYDSKFVKAVLTVMEISLDIYPKKHPVWVLTPLKERLGTVIARRYRSSVELNALLTSVSQLMRNVSQEDGVTADGTQSERDLEPGDFRNLGMFPRGESYSDMDDLKKRDTEGRYKSVDNYLDFQVIMIFIARIEKDINV